MDLYNQDIPDFLGQHKQAVHHLKQHLDLLDILDNRANLENQERLGNQIIMKMFSNQEDQDSQDYLNQLVVQVNQINQVALDNPAIHL